MHGPTASHIFQGGYQTPTETTIFQLCFHLKVREIVIIHQLK